MLSPVDDSRRRSADAGRRTMQDPALRQKCAEAGRRSMQDPELRRYCAEAGKLSRGADPEVARENSKKYWSNPDSRRAQSARKRGRVGRALVECQYANHLKAQGWQVYLKGYPDIFAIAPDGHAEFFEVKGPGDKLRKHQRRLHEVLRQVAPVSVVYVGCEDPTASTTPQMDDGAIRKLLLSVEGVPANEAAAHLGVSAPFIYKYRRQFGLPNPRRNLRRQLDLVAVAGLSHKEAARVLGVSKGLVQIRRREAGIVLSRPPHIEVDLEAIAGLSAVEASRQLGVSARIIQKRRREAGIKRLPRVTREQLEAVQHLDADRAGHLLKVGAATIRKYRRIFDLRLPPIKAKKPRAIPKRPYKQLDLQAVEGLSPREAARVLGVSRETVEVHRLMWLQQQQEQKAA